MKKIKSFIVNLYVSSNENDLFALANELTYQLLLAFFPFLIFLMTVVGFLEFDSSLFLEEMSFALPEDVFSLIDSFIKEVIDKKHLDILSTSLLVSVFTISNAFMTVIKGVNKIHNKKETRHFIIVRLLSVLLVFIFTFFIIISLLTLVFSNIVYDMAHFYYEDFNIPKRTIINTAFLIATVILLIGTVLIYRMAYGNKIKLRYILPGVIITVVFWVLTSLLFSLYVNNFTKFSTLYGSIGSIFVFILWLNLISTFLLLGVQINASLYKTDNIGKG